MEENFFKERKMQVTKTEQPLWKPHKNKKEASNP